jgi:hypothetical protein
MLEHRLKFEKFVSIYDRSFPLPPKATLHQYQLTFLENGEKKEYTLIAAAT